MPQFAVRTLCLASVIAATFFISSCAHVVAPTVKSGAIPLATELQTPVTLKILTWNIWLMPRITGQARDNSKRAPAIADELLKLDADILCLDKAFDEGPRKVIAKALAAKYPFQYGPVNPQRLFKFSSGVWILSKFPFDDYHDIQYDACSLIECFSRKGAALVTGSYHGHAFQLVATHTQGEQGPKYTAIRERQFQQLRDTLVQPFADPKVPLIFAGDLTTERRRQSDMPEETDEYKFVLRTLDAENGADYRITLDDDPKVNDLCDDCNGHTAEMDYVLVRTNGVPLSVSRQVDVLQHPGWDTSKKHRKDLSYHYSVLATVTFQ